MKRVILESPYRALTDSAVMDNVVYARVCLRDCLARGEAPIASHLLYTQEGVLDDKIEHEREMGINAGLAWVPVADYSVFYTDRGWSKGMYRALFLCTDLDRPFMVRALNGAPHTPSSREIRHALGFEDVE
jgi:hypothetical protein